MRAIREWPAANSEKLSAAEIREFNGYLANCTDQQVEGVLEKEQSAGREAYAELARQEQQNRQRT